MWVMWVYTIIELMDIGWMGIPPGSHLVVEMQTLWWQHLTKNNQKDQKSVIFVFGPSVDHTNRSTVPLLLLHWLILCVYYLTIILWFLLNLILSPRIHLSSAHPTERMLRNDSCHPAPNRKLFVYCGKLWYYMYSCVSILCDDPMVLIWWLSGLK